MPALGAFRDARPRNFDGSATGPRSWTGSLLVGGRDASGLLYRRNRSLDPKTGRFTQEDPIGLAGGLDVYGFANGDPVNDSDPCGLCPPEDNHPCDMSTGDPNLDDPASRNVMERGCKNARTDRQGYRIEQGGVCYKDGQCVSGRNANRENIDIVIDGERPVQFDWHTHPNEERPRPSGIPGDMYTDGPSGPDISDAEMVYGNPVLGPFGNDAFPSYIIGANKIYRLTPDENRKATVTTFNRWIAP